MFKTVGDLVWAFDCEWVPDALSGRLLYNLPDATEEEVLQRMWQEGGATESDPTPFLKLIQCRVVSIAMVQRKTQDNAPAALSLHWLPRDTTTPESRSESTIITSFLGGIGKRRPQLVGFNSRNSDLRILTQRAVTLGVTAPDFCRRPAKPWEGDDYFARDNECHIDLMDTLSGGWSSRGNLSLHELAAISAIPGKFDTHGDAVVTLWREGRYDDIIRYNCFDALTTYLVWLRTAFTAGKFTPQQYLAEQKLLRDHLLTLAADPATAWIDRYLQEWDRLQAIREKHRHD